MGRDDRRIVAITGMAAGFTVLFAAPLGSAVFALEILHRRGLEYYEALLPAAVGSLCGYGVSVALTGVGLEPLWHFPSPGVAAAVDFAWAVGGRRRRAPPSPWSSPTPASASGPWRTGCRPGRQPAIGGAGARAARRSRRPYALTNGEVQIDHLTLGRTAAVALAGGRRRPSCIAAAVAMATGWRGGFIIPLFFVGYCLARAFGSASVPGSHTWVLVAALMVACNVGVTKTPIGSTLVVTEMSGAALLPTTLVAALVSLLLTSQLGLIHSQRRRFAPFSSPAADVLAAPGAEPELSGRPAGGRTFPRDRVTGRPLSDRDYESLAAFRRALRGFLAFSEQEARAAGVTPAHHQLLLAIRGHQGGSPSITDIADTLQVKLHSATELVARAEAKGLVVRSHDDPGDARRAVLALTDEGAAKLADLSHLHRAELRRFRDQMNDILGELD